MELSKVDGMLWSPIASASAAAAIALWLISLLKILLTICRVVPTSPKFLASESGSSKRRKHVLLVIAHPDDESMFFTPTLLYLTSEGHNVHVLCISTGDADGKGNVRKEEFYKACSILKVSMQHIKIIDHPDLQDGFNRHWDPQLLASIIEEEIKVLKINVILTFDHFGISGHRNHQDVHYGVCAFLSSRVGGEVDAWELISTSIIRKYSGPVDIWLSILFSFSRPKGRVYCLINNHPKESYLAMAQHRSQWVWFRKLFMVFSSYTYVNTLRRLTIYQPKKFGCYHETK